MVILGSREQLCIHREVSLLRGSAQNNACRFLCKKGTNRRCNHHSRVAGNLTVCTEHLSFLFFLLLIFTINRQNVWPWILLLLSEIFLKLEISQRKLSPICYPFRQVMQKGRIYPIRKTYGSGWWWSNLKVLIVILCDFSWAFVIVAEWLCFDYGIFCDTLHASWVLLCDCLC